MSKVVALLYRRGQRERFFSDCEMFLDNFIPIKLQAGPGKLRHDMSGPREQVGGVFKLVFRKIYEQIKLLLLIS